MKKLLLALLCPALVWGAGSDLPLTQRNAGNTANTIVTVAPAVDSLLGFNGSKVVSNVTIGSGLALSGGVLTASGGGGGAPTDATYITQIPNGSLSAEQALSALATGILKSTTTTGVLSIAVAGDFPTLNQNTTGSAATLTTGRTISISGDLTYTSPAFDGSGNVTAAGTLATVNGNVGSFGSATQSLSITANGKGLITAISAQTVTPAVGSITGLGTNVATALAVNTGSAGAFQVNNASGAALTTLTAANISVGALANGMTATTQAAAENSTKLATTAYVDRAVTTNLVETLAVFSIDGAGAAITTGTVSGTKRLPFACTLTGYSITATAATGTTTVKFWNVATGTAIPTIANVINTSGVSLTTGTAVASATLSDFTDTSFAALDMMRCAVTAVDGTATDLTVTLYGTRN